MPGRNANPPLLWGLNHRFDIGVGPAASRVPARVRRAAAPPPPPTRSKPPLQPPSVSLKKARDTPFCPVARLHVAVFGGRSCGCGGPSHAGAVQHGPRTAQALVRLMALVRQESARRQDIEATAAEEQFDNAVRNVVVSGRHALAASRAQLSAAEDRCRRVAAQLEQVDRLVANAPPGSPNPRNGLAAAPHSPASREGPLEQYLPWLRSGATPPPRSPISGRAASRSPSPGPAALRPAWGADLEVLKAFLAQGNVLCSA